MSQKAVFVRIDGWLVPEVFHSVPDFMEACQICLDNGYDAEENECNFYDVEYEWYDIGEGESGVDDFIEEEALLDMYDDQELSFETLVEQRYGLEAEYVDSGDIMVTCEDLREDDMEEE